MKQLFIFLLFIHITSWSQETFEWSEGTCRYTGTVQNELATQVQLTNIQKFLVNSPELTRPALPSRPKDTLYIRLDLVQQECSLRIKELQDLDVPTSDFWKDVKKLKIRELTEECALKELAINAFQNPELLKYSLTCDSCESIVLALIKGEKALLTQWEMVHSWTMKDATNPEYLQAIYDYNKSDIHALYYARIDVMRYAWWNCANAQLPKVTNFTEIQLEFEKLLKGVTKSCL